MSNSYDDLLSKVENKDIQHLDTFNESDWKENFPNIGAYIDFITKLVELKIERPEIIKKQISLFINNPTDLYSVLNLVKKHGIPLYGTLEYVDREHWQKIFKTPEEFAEFLEREPTFIKLFTNDLRFYKKQSDGSWDSQRLYAQNFSFLDVIKNADDFSRLVNIFDKTPELAKSFYNFGKLGGQFDEVLDIICKPSATDFFQKFIGNIEPLATFILKRFYHNGLPHLPSIDKLKAHNIGNEALFNRLQDPSLRQKVIMLMEFSSFGPQDEKEINWLLELDAKQLDWVLSNQKDKLNPQFLNVLEHRLIDPVKRSIAIRHNVDNEDHSIQRLEQLTAEDLLKMSNFKGTSRELSALAEHHRESNPEKFTAIIRKHIDKLDKQFWEKDDCKYTAISQLLCLWGRGKEHLARLGDNQKNELKTTLTTLSAQLTPLVNSRVSAGNLMKTLVSPLLFWPYILTPEMEYRDGQPRGRLYGDCAFILIFGFPIWFPIAMIATGAGVIGAGIAGCIKLYQNQIDEKIDRIMENFPGERLKLAEIIVRNYSSSTPTETTGLLEKNGLFNNSSSGRIEPENDEDQTMNENLIQKGNN